MLASALHEKGLDVAKRKLLERLLNELDNVEDLIDVLFSSMEPWVYEILRRHRNDSNVYSGRLERPPEVVSLLWIDLLELVVERLGPKSDECRLRILRAMIIRTSPTVPADRVELSVPELTLIRISELWVPSISIEDARQCQLLCRWNSSPMCVSLSLLSNVSNAPSSLHRICQVLDRVCPAEVYSQVW